MFDRYKIQIELIKLAGGTRLMRLTEPASGLTLERKLDPQLAVVRQKEQLMVVFEAALVRMNGVTKASLQMGQGRHTTALAAVTRTIQAVETLESLDNETFDFEQECLLEVLRDLARHIQRDRPVSPAEQLERQLQGAIEAQEFERAAKLRDRLLALKGKTVSP
jgi:hypothetical protein